MYDSIDIKEIDQINVNTSSKNMLIDIRDKYEYILGNIKNSVNIPYNYLICNNGAMVFDANNNIIESNPLPQDEIEKIKKIIQIVIFDLNQFNYKYYLI